MLLLTRARLEYEPPDEAGGCIGLRASLTYQEAGSADKEVMLNRPASNENPRSRILTIFAEQKFEDETFNGGSATLARRPSVAGCSA